MFPNNLWYPVKDGNNAARGIFDRHYSRRSFKDGYKPRLFVGPGQKMVLLTSDFRALFVWRKFISDDGQQGLNCAVFRNEGAGLSSKLILEAEELARNHWPAEKRFYTYVDPKKVKSANPGFCFIMAGWRRCGVTKKKKLIIFEKTLEAA